MAFSSLGLHRSILETITQLGYTEPTPIQAKAIPAVLAGRDVMAAAQTGTGKTAGFTLPILHHLISNPIKPGKGNQVRVLVLTPTRELAAQVAQSVHDYGRNAAVKSVVVFGGVSINPQMKNLRGGADVLIATPGRLLDLHNQGAVKFDQLEVLVLDEADRMLDMGFIVDIKRIIKLIPKQRQNLLFSATFSNDVRALAKTIVNDPVEVSVTPPNSTVDAIEQSLIAVEKSDKTAVLARLIKERDWFQVLVFARTRHGASRLSGKLEKQGINAAAIHGDKSQSARTKALAQFKSGKLRVLVATDIAARGIDIEQLPQVVNFDLPQVAEDYVHRIGRTGRAGATGHALSLVSHDEFKLLADIERLIKKVVPRIELEGYEPLNALKDSDPNFKPIKEKKAKKGKGADKKRSGREPSAKPAKAQRGKSQGGKSQDRKPAKASKPRSAPTQARAPRVPAHTNNAQEESNETSSWRPLKRKAPAGDTPKPTSKGAETVNKQAAPALNRKARRAHLQTQEALEYAKNNKPGKRGAKPSSNSASKPKGKPSSRPVGRSRDASRSTPADRPQRARVAGAARPKPSNPGKVTSSSSVWANAGGGKSTRSDSKSKNDSDTKKSDDS